MTGSRHSNRRAARISALTTLAVLLPLGASAADGDDEPERVAIQERKFQLFHELKGSIGTMPLDPYQKGWTLSLSYTHHFNDFVAWEILQLTGSFLTSTNLRDSLIEQFAVSPQDFSAPRFLVSSGVEFSPFYGKMAFINDGVSHHAVLLGAYAALAFGNRVDGDGAFDAAETFSDLRPGVGLGFGYRVHITETVSGRLDVRDFVVFRRGIRDNESFEVDNLLLMTLSIGFNLGRDDA